MPQSKDNGLDETSGFEPEVLQWSRLWTPCYICVKMKAGHTAGRLLASGHLHDFGICLTLKVSKTEV